MKPIQYIKHLFIPNLHNSFHPHMLRTPALATVAATLLIAQITLNVVWQSPSIFGMRASIESEELIQLSNQARTNEGVGELRTSPRLQHAAQAKADDMIERDYWSHYAPDGTSPWFFIESEGYNYRFAGENLAKSFQTSQGVLHGWLQSPDHRDNLLDSRFSEIGIATASGRLEGEDTTVVVAMYATPQPVSVQLGETPVRSAVSMRDAPQTPVSYSVVNPLFSFAVLPLLTQIATIASLSLGALFVMQHVVVRRKRLLWDAHIHPRPILQAVVLFGVAALLVQTGFGVVG